MISKSIILIDFDNIFLGLWSLDRELAMQFASEPKRLLEALAERYLIEERRRWLVARCYLNPNGSVVDTRADDGIETRRYFSRFRPFWVGAGFEVVDMPPLARDKNAADIRIVIDALDLAQHPAGYDEFVIASGDSDFTPLLHRLRANNRLITIMAPGNASKAYTSLADRILNFDAIMDLLKPVQADAAPLKAVTAAMAENGVNPEVQLAFADFIRSQFNEATEPLNLAALAEQAARNVPGVRESKWVGAGTFTAAVTALKLPNAQNNATHLWDVERHQEPVIGEPFLASDLPEVIELLARTVDLPRLEQKMWPILFDTIEEFLRDHEFNLGESTKWARDTLAAAGTAVGRAAINFVVRGAQFGGAPLGDKPPPDSAEIAHAFMGNLINLAYAGGVNIDIEDERVIADWLGLGSPEPE